MVRLEPRVRQHRLIAAPPEARGPGFLYPEALESQALERLALLDVEGAREPLGEISRRLAAVGRNELPAARLIAFDLLSAINRLIWPGPAGTRRRADFRDLLVSTFARIEQPAELKESFGTLVRQILAPFEGSRAGAHPAVSRAKAFIHEAYHRKISLREVAVHLGLSRTYLSTLFRRECGCTLTEYLHRIRMRRAQELIRSGTGALSWVAARVGYQNYRDFHRNFVRFQNASPKRFQLDMASALPPPSDETDPR